MSVALSAASVIATAYVTFRVCAHQAKRAREEETRRRWERRSELLALEAKYLKEGFDDPISDGLPDAALRSLGNVAYLIWLLNYEPNFRNYRGNGNNPYPPDWEWRRKFVFLRDRGICQGCKKHSSQGITLDCHHIKPISEFGPQESDIHSLANLVSLCPTCHADQHLGNQMLAARASRPSSRDRNWLPPSGKRRTKGPSSSSGRTFTHPGAIEVHSFPAALPRQIAEPPLNLNVDGEPAETGESMRGLGLASNDEAQGTRARSHAKSVTDGLGWIEKRISDMKLRDAARRCTEEDIYVNCDYCDKEILANPFHASIKGKFLCDDCFLTTRGEE